MGVEREADLSSVERRLARLRFDLHDGPQQDVHLLAADLMLFREQLLPFIADDPNADRLLGRLDDLSARLLALDQDIRKLASALESPFQHSSSLPVALKQIIDAFAARTGIEPDLQLDGDFEPLSESQRITLLSLIREALSNVRKHSGAARVTVQVSAGPGGVHATVGDDGHGFDPETTLELARREGHLGLVGMRERAGMLGGKATITSHVGGPTTVSLSLPVWP